MAVYGKTVGRSQVLNVEARPNQDRIAYGSDWGAVFDGLGGHAGSEHASQLAAAAVTQFSGPDEQWAFHALQHARQQLVAARDEGVYPEMTCAAAVVHISKNKASVAWTGDVRVFLRRGKTLQRLTEDHDLLYHATMSAKGLPAHVASRLRTVVANAHTASDAWRAGGGLAKKAFRKNNLVYAELSSGEISKRSVEVLPNDLLIVTCDGVHDNSTQQQMEQVLEHVTEPQTAVEVLINQAIFIANHPESYPRGHGDDISCVALRVE